MGYVFTPQEFEEGRIPSASDYQSAMKLLRKGLLGLYDTGMIYGANLHGSNFHGDGGVGSDIDVLVVTNSQEAEEHLRKLYSSIRDYRNIPIEFVPTSKQLAEGGHHSLDSFYIKYIQGYCRDGIIGDDPIKMFSPGDG